jgi:uridylate kinase
MSQPSRYKRVLLKISGEVMMGDLEYGIDRKTVERLAEDVRQVHAMGVEVSVVVGGGNIFRGMAQSARGMDRSTADYMGMLATIMNAVALQDGLERRDVPTRVLSAIEISQLAEPYIRRRAVRHLEKGRVVIFAAGTGNPFFTTDTAAALRANEIAAEVLLKATKVRGVYDKDPNQHDDARRYSQLSFQDAIEKNLRVMDSTAFTMCRDNKMPVVIFDMNEPGNIRRVIAGEAVGTAISDKHRTRFA